MNKGSVRKVPLAPIVFPVFIQIFQRRRTIRSELPSSRRSITAPIQVPAGATLELEARLLGSNAKQRVIALGANQRGKRIAGASMEIEL